jgi:uncharacterized BrkB/YihY/UPF0761 family membrane protein
MRKNEDDARAGCLGGWTKAVATWRHGTGMNWLKCTVTGLLAVFITAIVVPISVSMYLVRQMEKSQRDAVGAIGWDPIGLATLPRTWVILGGAFAAGFLWEYRWLKRHPRRK